MDINLFPEKIPSNERCCQQCTGLLFKIDRMVLLGLQQKPGIKPTEPC